jgi:hypothetical protein
VRGINLAGTEVNPVTAEYQICFRCHADSPGQPAPRTGRQFLPPPDQSGVRGQLAPGNPSYHPVVAPGVNPNVPSLLPPWTTSSVMKCSDCHDNNAGPAGGGTGPKGPHGSNYPTLLARQYITNDRTTESAAAYDLCYKCHNRTRFITATNGASPFGGDTGHQRHVVQERTPCNVCHDPHGISSTQSAPAGGSKLINFDTSVVAAVGAVGGAGGRREFISLGLNHGQCYLVCHGNTHNPRSY